MLGLQREEEGELLDIVRDEGHQFQTEDPLLDEVEQRLGTHNPLEEELVEPIESDVLGVDVPLEFGEGSGEDRSDEFVVDESLEDFLVGEVLPAVEADHQPVVVGSNAGDSELDFRVGDGDLVERPLPVVAVVVPADHHLDLLELLAAVVQLHLLLAPQRAQLVEHDGELVVADPLELLVLLHSEVLARLVDLLQDLFGLGGQHLLVELTLLSDLLLFLPLLGNQALV